MKKILNSILVTAILSTLTALPMLSHAQESDEVLTDTDHDGLLDEKDNCVSSSNPSQLDTDGDSLGDVCDSDNDGDDVPDSVDAYPMDSSRQ